MKANGEDSQEGLLLTLPALHQLIGSSVCGAVGSCTNVTLQLWTASPLQVLPDVKGGTFFHVQASTTCSAVTIRVLQFKSLS